MIRVTLRRATTTAPRGHPWVFSTRSLLSTAPPNPVRPSKSLRPMAQRLGTGYYTRIPDRAALLTRRHESIDTSEFFVTALKST